MTKDEAEELLTKITEVSRYDRRWPDILCWIRQYGEARAQAAVDAFKADTLGMLEALAKMVGEVHTKEWWISYDKHTDQFTYRRYLYFSFSGDSITATRAEAEALLKGDVADADA